LLEEEVKKATGFNKSKNRQPRLIETGIDLGTNDTIKPTREELHARH